MILSLVLVLAEPWPRCGMPPETAGWALCLTDVRGALAVPVRRGPTRLCSKHFAVRLHAGEQVVARAVDGGGRLEQVISTRRGTIVLGEETYRAWLMEGSSPFRPVAWRKDIWRRSLGPGESGMPYILVDGGNRYAISAISGSALNGGPRDALALAGVTTRSPATRCDGWLELGDIHVGDRE